MLLQLKEGLLTQEGCEQLDDHATRTMQPFKPNTACHVPRTRSSAALTEVCYTSEHGNDSARDLLRSSRNDRLTESHGEHLRRALV